MSIQIIKNLTVAHIINDDYIINEELCDDEAIGFVVQAEILYHGAKVTTEIIEAQAVVKNHFEVTAYDFGEDDLQIGDEQTIFYIDGKRAGLFWELPDALQAWATQEVKRIFKEINTK